MSNTTTYTPPAKKKIKAICMADVTPKKIEWLWKPVFPIGKVSLLASNPKCGKSTVTMDIAARVTTGRPWPLHFSGVATKGSVVLLSAEDDPDDTIRPRLDVAGADPKKVHFLDVNTLHSDLESVEEFIRERGDVRLVVIDPVDAYLGGTDSHKNAEVRGALKPLADMASRLKVAVLCVMHLTKSNARDRTEAIYRIQGSIAFAAAARAVWGVVEDRCNQKRFLMLNIGSNLTRDNIGMAYRVVSAPDNPDIGMIEWEPTPIHNDANDAMNSDEQRRDPDQQAIEEVIREALADGEKSYKELEDAVVGEGLSKRRIRDILKSIGAVKRKAKGSKTGGWYWRLHDTPLLEDTENQASDAA